MLAAMLESVRVALDSYTSPLHNLASVTVADSQKLALTPYDASVSLAGPAASDTV